MLIKNPKVFLLILMGAYESKDELFYFLVRISKKNGLHFLQKYYDVIDKYLPMSHHEKYGFNIKITSVI